MRAGGVLVKINAKSGCVREDNLVVIPFDRILGQCQVKGTAGVDRRGEGRDPDEACALLIGIPPYAGTMPTPPNSDPADKANTATPPGRFTNPCFTGLTPQ